MAKRSDADDRLTVHTLEAIYGQESSFGTMMRKPGSSAATGHFHLEPASPKKERAKEKAREIQQYVEKVLSYEIEFTQKSPAGKGKTAKKGRYRCTEGGHWITIDDRPIYIC